MKIAFIGLGVMGYSMAGHQQQAGHQVTVYNRTLQKAQRWADQYGGSYKETPALASEDADIVMICVGNDDDVRSVTYGDQGILSGLREGGIIVDHTTTSRELATELAEACAIQNIDFLDAPVSGGQSGAEKGSLAVMVGGQQSILDKAAVAINSYSKTLTLMGPTGAGQVSKMVNQILIAGILQGISEGFTLAKAAGLDIPLLLEAISQGAAGSWQLSNRGLNIDKDHFDYGFAIDWMVKDLGFCVEAANTLQLTLPNTESVLMRYQELQQKGYGRCDTSALIKQFN